MVVAKQNSTFSNVKTNSYLYHDNVIYISLDINTAGTAGIHACGDIPNTLRETLMQGVSLKQEAPHSGGVVHMIK